MSLDLNGSFDRMLDWEWERQFPDDDTTDEPTTETMSANDISDDDATFVLTSSPNAEVRCLTFQVDVTGSCKCIGTCWEESKVRNNPEEAVKVLRGLAEAIERSVQP